MFEMAIDEPKDAPDSWQPWLEHVLVAMTLLAMLATSLRIISRRLNRQALWWDDWLAVWNMAWLLITVGFVSTAIALGLGLHVQYVSPENIVALIKVVLVTDVLYLWSLVWSKVTVLLLYYRVFRFGYFKSAAYAIGGLVVVLAIVSTFLTGFLCVPLQRVWDPSVPGHCLSQTNIRFLNSASSIFTDIVILCLPAPQIWKLQLRKSEKAGLIFFFALGFFVVFAAAYRISVFIHDNNHDVSYSLAPDAGWTVLELSAAAVSASLPAMGPAIIKGWNWLYGYWYGFTSCIRHIMAENKFRRGERTNTTTELEDGVQATLGKHNSGSFHRLADLNNEHSGEAVVSMSPVVVMKPTPLEKAGQVKKDEAGYAFMNVRSDEASDEVSFNVVRVRTSISQTSTRLGV